MEEGVDIIMHMWINNFVDTLAFLNQLVSQSFWIFVYKKKCGVRKKIYGLIQKKPDKDHFRI